MGDKVQSVVMWAVPCNLLKQMKKTPDPMSEVDIGVAKKF